MVVDDNVDTADSTAMLLRRFGHDVRVQYSSKSALAEAPVFRPDVVILDIGLPEMNGYEVARRFRQDPGFPNLRLIALSGYGQDADRKNSSEAGFDEHLIKPAEPHMLLESLRAS
jgi:CheY-like chemotaxis protein